MFLPPHIAQQHYVFYKDKIRRLFLPPPTPERSRMLRALEEKQPHFNYGAIFSFFRHLWAGEWAKIWQLRLRLPEAGEAGQFDWVDNLAESYAGRYRSSVLMAYILGACVFLFAVSGIAFMSNVLFAVELGMILAILFSSIYASRKCWYERWMDYRLLAEALRQMELLARIGRIPPSIKGPVTWKPSEPWRSWTNWHFRALVRQRGLMGGRIDHEYIEGYRRVLQKEIGRQVKFHHASNKSYERLHHRQELVVKLLFVLAATACVLQLTIDLPRDYEILVRFCAIILPVFGAVVHAILHKGDFERIALRSHAIEARLSQLLEEVKKSKPDANHLGRIAEEFAEVMMSELVDWRSGFLDKSLIFSV
jgi:hypothetical protein